MALQVTNEGSNPSTRVNTPAPPLSPTLAQNVLDGNPDIELPVLRLIANGLISTIRTREEQHNAVEQDRREEIDMLRTRLDDYSKTYFTPPPGFMANDGRLPQFTVPTDENVVQVVRWIRRLSDGRVAGHLQDDGPRDDPYIAELYAGPVAPDPNRPIEPLPQWFRRLLVSPSTQYHVLRDTAYGLDDWSIHAEILRFRRIDDAVTVLNIQLDQVTNELRAMQRDRRACEMRLEASRAHTHFAHLEVARRFNYDRPRSSRHHTRASVSFVEPAEEHSARLAQED